MITFVGRPADTVKGISTLFEAIEILCTLADLPIFSVWIIGGSKYDTANLERAIDAYAGVANLLRQSRLVLWRRVTSTALPELYSRSVVTVMPSRRERFGRTAIEAMACGCPVIASRVEGLPEVVIDGVTGNLIPPNRPDILASVLAGYLRNPQRREMLGRAAREWSELAFDERDEFKSHLEVYSGIESLHYKSLPSARRRIDAARWQRIKPEITILQDIEDEPREFIGNIEHLVVRSQLKGTDVVVKVFGEMPSLQACLFESISTYNYCRRPSDRLRRALVHRNNPCALPFISECEYSAVIVQPVGNRFEDLVTHPLDVAALMRVREITDVTQVFGATRLNLATATIAKVEADILREHLITALNCSVDAASDEWIRVRALISRYDTASANMNEPITGSYHIFVASHPFVELARLGYGLWCHHWPLSELEKNRLLSGLRSVLLNSCDGPNSPSLCHGALKSAHLLEFQGKSAATRWDNSAFVFGDIDMAIYVFNVTCMNSSDATPERAFDAIRTMQSTASEFSWCIAWLLAHAATNLLWDQCCGRSTQADKISKFLVDLPLLFHRHLLSFGDEEAT